MQAAKYLGVPPWELAQMPTAWTEWAQAAMDIENEVERARAKKDAHAARSKKGGRGRGPRRR